MQLTDAIEKRRSIRKFKKKKVKWAQILEAIDAAIKAPLAGNISTIRFIIITNQDIKNKLAQHTDQDWIAEADTIIACCSDQAQLERMYYDRASAYAHQQVGAAIQNLLLRLTELKLGACWIGAYLDTAIKRDLKIPEKVSIEALIAVGHPDEKPRAGRKVELQNVIAWEDWNQKKRPVASKDPATW